MIRNAARLASLRDKIAEQVNDKSGRLFAIIHLQARQFRVIEGDIIHIEHNTPLKFGDRIKLEKASFLLEERGHFCLGSRCWKRKLHIARTTDPQQKFDQRKCNCH